MIESILNRPRLVAAARSVISTRESGSSFEIVMVSLLTALSPKFSTLTDLRTNGSFFVPLPDTKLGLAVVFSGSGPFLYPTITSSESPLSLARYISGTSNSNRSRGKQTQIHHMVLELLSLSFFESDFADTHVTPSSLMFSGILSASLASDPHLSSSSSDHPSPSVSNSRASQDSESVGKSESSSGSVPHSTSSASFTPSSSSSKSSFSPVVELPDNESGSPSPSVSLDAERSSGKSSTLFPTPSPSRSSSCESQIMSPSESVGTLDASSGSEPHDSSGPSAQPSKSLSDCKASQTPSLSSSIGMELESSVLELHIISSVSMYESLSSSSSM